MMSAEGVSFTDGVPAVQSLTLHLRSREIISSLQTTDTANKQLAGPENELVTPATRYQTALGNTAQ
jgi:hypothetical protein